MKMDFSPCQNFRHIPKIKLVFGELHAYFQLAHLEQNTFSPKAWSAP